jgi:hypothetical protein
MKKSENLEAQLRKLIHIGALALGFGLVPPSAVNATELRYIITSFDIPTIVFELPQNPIPDSYFLDKYPYYGSGSFTIDGVTFFADGGGSGGLRVGGYEFIYGPQMYVPPENSPTLLAGVFEQAGPFGLATVAVFALPEPSTWAMMLFGFAGLAYAGYRRAGASRATVAA